MRLANAGTRSVLSAIALLLLASLTVVAGGSAARTPEASGSESLIEAQWTPLGLRSGKTTVVVQLAGDPVAKQQGDAGRKLSKSEKQAIKSQLKAKQDGLRGSIANLGGEILADYQVAYNGLKVRIDRSKTEALGNLTGVTSVHPLQLVKPDNVRGVPFIGAPSVWDGVAGLHGENIKIAVIDTGIDYTHANFGGPGTTAAFDAAEAANTLAPSPALGWGARVKGGIDLVGDDYDADPASATFQPVPHPDPNPLDCNGHGSHVAGSAAGSGVTAAGATYTGPYNATTVSGNSWTIGPGVAPKADLYAVRVFGCLGSTDVTVDAIEWAVENDMDVINMSLGSSFGTNDDPSAVATTNAAKAGVVVVTSAGNSGPSQYITGSPGTADGAISTAAVDSTENVPGVTIQAGALSIPAVNANEHVFGGPLAGPLKVIQNDPLTPVNEAEGCSTAAFGALAPGTIAVVIRGTCARVAKAIFGEQAGAAAVVMVNNAPGLPPVEGPITSNPDDGTPFTVTIPFLGVKGPFTDPASDGSKLRLVPDGTATTLTPANIVNPGFRGFASFSSGGPRGADSALKPDITAPGVAIVSTGVGTGNGRATISGTSMASPHAAGVAALTRQAHPSWKVEDLKAAIVNTGDPSLLVGYRTSRGGTGLVQPAKSTKTQVVAKAEGEKFAVSVNYGFEELKSDFSKEKTIKLHNHGSSPATFNVAQANAAGSAHALSLSKTSVTVPAGGDADVKVRLTVPVATAGLSNGAGLSFQEVAGLVQFTPATAADNGGVALRVPYYLVPRALSEVKATSDAKKPKGNAAPSNFNVNLENKGAVNGDADFYAWGLEDKKDKGKVSNDVRGIGVQAFDFGGPQLLVFAVNTYDRWSNAATNEFDIALDVDQNGTDDYVVVGVDDGAVQTGDFNGIMRAFVFSTTSPGASSVALAVAPTDSSTILLPILTSQLCRAGEPCLNAANPRFTYSAASFDLNNGGVDEVDGTAEFNAFNPSISTGGFQTLAPGATSSEPIAVNAAEWALTPTKGVMVVALDNKSGKDEAELLEIKK